MFKIKNPFEQIVFGLFLHLSGNYYPFLLGFRNELVSFLIMFIGWCYIIKGFRKIRLRCPFVGWYKILFFSYVMICIVMIVRGYLIDYRYQWESIFGIINFHLFSQYYILPYLMPIVAFIPFSEYNLSLYKKIGYYVSIIAIILCILNYGSIVSASHDTMSGKDDLYGYGAGTGALALTVSFIALCYPYMRKKEWLVYFCSLIISLFVTLIAARRGTSFSVAMILCSSLLLLAYSLKGAKRFGLFLGASIMFVIAFYYFENSSDFAFIHQRGDEDTRSGVDIALLSQMDTNEMIFGKGLNGRYYYPLHLDDRLDGWRYVTETGFYNIVLKGGFLMAIVYIILLLFPAVKGIFFSKNVFCKALGLFILVSLIELYPFGWLAFDMRFFIIWIGIPMCMDENIRLLSNKEVYNWLFVNIPKSKSICNK